VNEEDRRRTLSASAGVEAEFRREEAVVEEG